jgi:hypothetical protein
MNHRPTGVRIWVDYVYFSKSAINSHEMQADNVSAHSTGPGGGGGGGEGACEGACLVALLAWGA